MANLEQRLHEYKEQKKFRGKGQLAVMLHITRLAAEHGLPLDAASLRTQKEGQVAGLSKSRIQTILKDHGIERILAEEGGRTSRGSLGNAADYVDFLNALHADGCADLPAIEAWWADRVRDYFCGKPFTLKFDPSKSLRAIVEDLLAQAAKRQKDNPGTTYAGTVLQHLVGAKLDLILPEEKRPAHHGASVADASTARTGDFVFDDSVVHVTTASTEALLRKCKDNLDVGLHPIIVTIAESQPGLVSNAKTFKIDGRIDIIEAEQFIATNLMEWSHFAGNAQRTEIRRLIARYSEIVNEVETDPSLLIEM